MYSDTKKIVAACVLLIVGMGVAKAQEQSDSLKTGFANPPASARPQVWWHWMNGNVSKAGIQLDLDWMHRVGIGGFQLFEEELDTPQVVKHRAAFMTPQWQSDVKYATTLGERLGLDESIAGTGGWSETGGPWVPASQGMKKYVWSKTVIEGGRPFHGKLPHPPQNTGAFQGIGIRDVLKPPAGSKPIPQYYADSVVVAYRQPQNDVSLESFHPTITASGGSPDIAMLSDGDLSKATGIPNPPEGQTAWIQYAFAEPVTIRAATLAMDEPIGLLGDLFQTPERQLEASDDGQAWRTVAALQSCVAPEITVSFPPVKARYFRVVFRHESPWRFPAWMISIYSKLFGMDFSAPQREYKIAELVLHPGARVNHFEEKAAFVPTPDLYRYATPAADPSDIVKRSDVIDLTSKMRPDGTLDWTPPPGRWVVLRFGYSLLGITNHPATAEATGLEVDKLNGRDVHNYIENYLAIYKNAVGASNIGRRGIRNITSDSWEAGSQNWTDDMIEQFKRLRGYDPVPWMPVLTGEIVGSAAESDRFLWDFRKTIGDLIADEHYGTLRQVLNEWHMDHYCESHESGRAFVGDGMEVKKFCDFPMSAMWTQAPGVNKTQYDYNADDREAASVSHIYGKKFVAAESLTSSKAPWAWSPATLKPTIDQEFVNGINRVAIQAATHQPLLRDAPGLTLGPWGSWFDRNETWATEASPWLTYIARNSYMLQQGRFSADILYFYGEDTNLTAIYQRKSPNLPPGYGFDYVNADALIHQLKVNADGRIGTPGGVTYRVLGLAPNSRHMSLPALRAIHRLVVDGAVVAGARPEDDPSLADSQSEFHALVNEMFGDGTGVHQVGRGRVYAGATLAEALTAMQVPPDFTYASRSGGKANLKFVHRKLTDGDLYLVDNRSDKHASVDATFRVTGYAPELWYAETGKSEPVSYSISDGHTTVPLKLDAWGTVFVVFRKPTGKTSLTLPALTTTTLATIEGPWKVAFQPDRGAPASITLDKLSDWSKSEDSGVKYFSGVGTYTKTIQASPNWFRAGAHVWIDLGDVRNLAVVSVNGTNLGQVWHAPYRVDATAALKPGDNQIEVKVTNSWVNRIIGDLQPDAEKKYTFPDFAAYKATSPLLPSGLLGPVKLYAVGPQ
ncbi:MAG: glycosyl hydrolase [Acidobacteriaceae bacterium]